jgi:DMSO reductase family type II enzyme chaperone
MAKARSLGWRTLALAFYDPTEEWLETLLGGAVRATLSEATRRLDSNRERFAGGLKMLREYVTKQQGRDPQDVLRELKVEYVRLFIGPGAAHAPPYESVYRDRDPSSGMAIVQGPSAASVEAAYRQHGLGRHPSHSDLPDHVATELEFMYFLCSREHEAWEKGESGTAKELRRAQHNFLEEHLARWLPEFCGRVQNAAPVNVYFALAGILLEYLEVETGVGHAQSTLRGVFSNDG